MKALKAFLGKNKIGLIDVGARGGLEPRWRSIDSNIRSLLFEPDERSRNKIESLAHVEEVISMGLGEKEETASLNLCQEPRVSSLLNPHFEFVSRFPDSKRFEVIKSEPIKVTTLDKCLLGRGVEYDFIKIDTQGTELDILKGGDSILNSPFIGLEIEVEFLQLYKNQSLFGDVCSYLAKKNFEFFDFVNICRWERNNFTLFGQVIFGDGLFLRTPEVFGSMLNNLSTEHARSKALKYIAIVALYGHIDLLPVCVKQFKRFLEEEDIESVESFHKSLLRRRGIATFIIRVANRVLKLLGIQLIGLQKS